MDLTAANQGDNNNMLRDYRKGNWNLQETMVLIEAKKMDDERRTRRVGETTERGKPAELRWKWVEDYCWKNGCLRSQNQCNDKWDNLMRDFKKVRDYERRMAAGAGDEEKSYWRIEKSERKDNNLPSSMLPQIYEALVEVLERKAQGTVAAGVGSGGGGSSVCLPAVVVESNTGGRVLGHHQQLSVMMPPPAQHYSTAYRTPPTEAHGGAVPSSHDQPLHAVDSDTSEYSDPPAKRRKGRGGGGEGTSGGGTLQELGSAISKSASIIAEAIRSCEEREEERHKELLSVHERRLQIEESKAEINRQGINGVVDAINKLASSIFALAAHHNQSPSK